MDDKKPVAPQLQPTQQAAATELSGPEFLNHPRTLNDIIFSRSRPPCR